MDKQLIRTADDQSPSLLLFAVPEAISSTGSEQVCFAVPAKIRPGGLLLCLPRGVLSEETLIQASAGEDAAALVGPSKLVEVALCEEGEAGEITQLGASAHMYVVDFSDDVLAFLSEYDGVQEDEETPVVFASTFPAALPDSAGLVAAVDVWISNQATERVNFYSAREEPERPPSPKGAKGVPGKKASSAQKRVTNAQVLDQLVSLQNEMKLLSVRQSQIEAKTWGSSASPVQEPGPGGHQPPHFGGLPAVSSSLAAGKASLSLEGIPKAAKLLGPPPKTKQSQEWALPVTAQLDEPSNYLDPAGHAQPVDVGVASALVQQSTAITSLIAHLTAQADPFSDLAMTGSASASSTSTKGSQRRDRMMADLANGTSNYYLTLMQQVHKRMSPGRPLPKTEAELANISFLNYLERTGGYRSAREAGLMMWLLGHVLDAASEQNLWLVERLALAMVALEQSVVDSGDWTIAFLLSLSSDPPLTLFQDRTAVVSPYGAPFSPLVAPSWSATVLSFVKEMEILSSKKAETSPKKVKAAAASSQPEDPDKTDSPKRKPRFPRKPKEGTPVPK